MHFSTLLLAASGFTGFALAVPTAEAAAAAGYTWSVSKWFFCAQEDDTETYDYSFIIEGKRNGAIPKFKATCSGIQVGGYKKCNVQGANSASPKVYADVNLVDDFARVRVQTTYVDSEGCTYKSTGTYDAEGNCGDTRGSTFKISDITNSAVC